MAGVGVTLSVAALVFTACSSGPARTNVRLGTGEVLLTEDVRREVSRQRFPAPKGRVAGQSNQCRMRVAGDLAAKQVAFGMTSDDLEVVLEPLVHGAKLVWSDPTLRYSF